MVHRHKDVSDVLMVSTIMNTGIPAPVLAYFGLFTIEKLVKIGKLPERLYLEYEHSFKDEDIAPGNTIRIAFVPLL